MKNEVYATFNFYDEQHRRLAIFGEDKGNGVIDIVIFTCSKSDQFSKKIARKMYEIYKLAVGNAELESMVDFTVSECTIKCVNENKPNWTFIEFCKDYFLRKFTEQKLITKTYFA